MKFEDQNNKISWYILFGCFAVVGIVLLIAWGWHSEIHQLDHFRHYWAAEFNPYAWGGNISAWPIQAALAGTALYVVWKPLSRLLKRTFRYLTAELHAKLDHIIEHHPDIPPFEERHED